jgi:hypothetical protein
MGAIHKICGGKIIPIYVRDENGKKYVDALVCQGCFKEFTTDGETP